MNNIYASASSASSVTYGNIAQAVKIFLMDNFPKNYFKYDTITSEIAYRNMRRQLMKAANGMTNQEIVKRRKPELIIRPNFEVPNDGFLYDIPMTKMFDSINSTSDVGSLFPIVIDDDNHFEFLFSINRDRVDFDITINVSNQIQQIDLYKILVNQFIWNRTFAVDSSLEAILPNSILQWIGHLTNHPINDKEYTNIALLDYLNTKSLYPITYKMKNSSSRDEFFMYYSTQLYLTMTNLSVDSGSRKGMVEDTFPITFRISAEFNLPGKFFVGGRTPLSNQAEVAMRIKESDDAYSDFIPLFTVNNIYKKYSFTDGFKLFRNAIVELEHKEGDDVFIKDLFDLDMKMDKSIYTFIKNYTATNPYYTLLRLIILKDQEELHDTVDWYFDKSLLRIHFNKPDLKSRYRILIFINNIKLMENLVDEIEDSSTDTPKLR